ncbi:MAG TPA: hypothetical protein VIM57_11260, partial [Luteolibacter sp.]
MIKMRIAESGAWETHSAAIFLPGKISYFAESGAKPSHWGVAESPGETRHAGRAFLIFPAPVCFAHAGQPSPARFGQTFTGCTAPQHSIRFYRPPNNRFIDQQNPGIGNVLCYFLGLKPITKRIAQRGKAPMTAA